MRVIIVGTGIGGLTAALALHNVGIDVEVFDQARELAELGVGINLLPHATRELAALGLLPAFDAAGIRTRELIYTNRLGQVIGREPRGTDAGYNMPQFSIHRGKLHRVLLGAAERLGDGHIHTGCVLSGFESQRDRVIATFQGGDGSGAVTIAGVALVGCDGIHSTVRRIQYPSEGPPVWNGIWLWRGATDWPAYQDGRTMVIAGGNTAKFVFYPIHQSGESSDRRLTNWGVMAGIARAGEPPPQREDWSRLAKREQVIDFARQMFQLESSTRRRSSPQASGATSIPIAIVTGCRAGHLAASLCSATPRIRCIRSAATVPARPSSMLEPSRGNSPMDCASTTRCSPRTRSGGHSPVRSSFGIVKAAPSRSLMSSKLMRRSGSTTSMRSFRSRSVKLS